MFAIIKKFKLFFILLILNFSFLNAQNIIISVLDFPPYVVIKDNKPQGAFIEILDAVSKETNLNFEIIHYPNRRSKHALISGIVNANFPLGRNKDRDKWLYWSKPLMLAEYGFYINSKSFFFPKNIYDLSGQKVGVFGPSNTSKSLKDINERIIKEGYEPMQIDMLPDSTGQNLMKLMVNRLDAVFINKSLGRYQIDVYNIKDVDYAFTDKKLKYYLGFSKNHNEKELIDKFNKGVISIEKKGLLNKILRKYNLEEIN